MNRLYSLFHRCVPSVTLVLLSLLFLLGSCSLPYEPVSTDTAPDAYDEGISLIESLEAKDPNQVDTKIKEFRRQELIDAYEERLAPLKEDPSAVWSMYEDYVIVGDSRGADFKNISALDPDRNFAIYASTADTLPDHYDEIASMNPSYIFLSIGFMDLLYDEYFDKDDYREHMYTRLQDLQEHFPDAKIFINPLFHAIDEGLERFPRWDYVDEYDAIIREIAPELGLYYVNCDDILPTDEDYRDDGIHFTNKFMSRWAVRFMETLYDAESGLDTFDATYVDSYNNPAGLDAAVDADDASTQEEAEP